MSSPPQASASFVVSPWSIWIVSSPGLPPFEAASPSPGRFRSCSHVFSVFLSLDGEAAESCTSTFATAVGLLIVTSSHCSSSLPGIAETAPILATLIFPAPRLSSHCCGPLRCESLHVGSGFPFGEFASQGSDALCHGFEFSFGPSGMLGSGLLFRPWASRINDSPILHSSVQSHSLDLAAVFQSSSGIPCWDTASAQVAPCTVRSWPRKQTSQGVFSLDQSLCAVMTS